MCQGITRKGLRGLAVAGTVILLLAAGRAVAEDPEVLRALQARMEKLEKENRELKQLRDQQLHVTTTQATGQGSSPVQPSPSSGLLTPKEVSQIVADTVKDEAAKKKAIEEQKREADSHEWYQIGSVLGVNAEFRDGAYMWLTSPNKDFTLHIGSLMQYDNVFWTQSGALLAAPGSRVGPKQGVASGPAAGGIGDLEDGTYFRRIRPVLEGTFWETYVYRLNFDLNNDQFSTIGLNEFYVGATEVPVIGEVRVGHIRTPGGIEADMASPSRCATFMERSSYSEAIELNQQLITGLWAGNNFLDQHATLTTAIFRTDNAATSGVFFGDGQYGAQGRATILPLYECEGRHLLHLGVWGGWRNGTNNLATSPFRTFQLRARPELRDDDAAGSPSGAQLVPNANSNRMVDTGQIVASNDFLMGLELLYILGPFSVQAEYGWNWIDNAIGFAPAGGTLNPALASPQNYMFNGGYVQLAYTLTGENRAYDRRYGILNSFYYGPRGPFSNAWFVRDENGNLCCGPGAWEIAGRYSCVNLNDGSGLARIQGGVMDGFSVALNWYLNNNLNVMFDWVYNHRYDVATGVIPGYTSGYGMRVQLQF
jgi:phosphate-selective porin OprO/OprP